MKKISLMLLFVTLALTCCNNVIEATPHNIYSIKTKLPAAISNVESLPAYYKGYKVDLRDGRAEIPECGESQTFTVIFTENVEFCTRGKTVRCLKRIKNQPYSWYDLTLSFHTEKHDDEDKRVYSWSIEKRKENDVPERIPEHALVVLTDPDFIETLKPEPSIPGSVDVVLPTIVFKDDLNVEEFNDTVMQTIIGPALDLDAIHSKSGPACMAQQGSAVITTIAKRSL